MYPMKYPKLIILNLLLILTMLATACNLGSKVTPAPTTQETAATDVTATQTTSPTAIPTEEISGSYVPDARMAFASFNALPVQVQSYAVGLDIAPAWDQVYNPFLLSEEQIVALQQNGFVVSPGTELEFFTVYEKARYANLPIFVTSDAMLHSYHLLFDKVLRTAETEQFIPLLTDLNAAMLAQSDQIYQQLAGTDWEADALRLVAFYGVGSLLLDASAQVPTYAQELVNAELANINAASGILPSPLFPSLAYGEDYTQYIPRGHYTQSEALSAYFKSMMWYGRMTFRLKGSDAETASLNTRAALLVVYALRNAQVNGTPAVDAWADLYAPTSFFVGRSDDLTVTQYGDVID